MITRNPASRSVIIRPAGNIEALTAEHYRQTIRPLLDEGYRFIIFDMVDTNYLTSAGLGLLVEIHNSVSRNDGSLRLINCERRIIDLLKQTRLDTVFDAIEGEESGPVPFDELHAVMSEEILFTSQLHEMTERSLRASDPAEIADLMLKGATLACRHSRGALYFIHEDGLNATLAATSELDDAIEEGARTLIFPTPEFAEEMQGASKIVHVDARKTDDEHRGEIVSRLSFTHGLFVPIRGNSRCFGFAVLEWAAHHKAFENLVPTLETYSNICGLALEKASLLVQFEAQNDDLQKTLLSVQQFQSTLVDVGKLASLGAVISGLGHLLNNKLVPIMGYSQMLSESEDMSEKSRKQLKAVSTAAIELKELMEKIIKVSGAREISQDLVDINELVNKTITLLGYEIGNRDVAIRLCLADNLPLILGDHDLLIQALIATVHRACTSFPADREERWITIVTADKGSAVEITIEDNGEGLANMTEQEWLDPLVPYTELDTGRIFNYSIPRSVLKRHNGTMTLEDKESGGTIVKMTIPITRIDASRESFEYPEKQIA